jgi:hypothetical protein
MKIALAIQEMAVSEILKIIPVSYYQRIKAQDKNPLFKAFVIGHEGESRGKVAVDGKSYGEVIKRWAKKAIQKMFQKIKLGLELFHGHDKPENMNAHNDREQIGEVVGKDLRDIDGRLSTVVVGYIYPPYKKLKLDTASIEAFVNVDPDGDDENEIDVESITGIALADKNYETPGFPHAGLLAQLQAFTTDHTTKGGNEMAEQLTIGKVIDFIRSEKVRPSELFKKAEIVGDPIVEEVIKEKNPNEYEARKRIENEHEKEKQEWEKEKEELKKSLKDLGAKAAKTTITEKVKDILKQRKLSDQEQRFIKRNLDKFKIDEPDDEKAIEKNLDRFIDDQVDEFEAIQKEVFGKEEKKEDKEDSEEPNITDKTHASDIDDNDFIPD